MKMIFQMYIDPNSPVNNAYVLYKDTIATAYQDSFSVANIVKLFGDQTGIGKYYKDGVATESPAKTGDVLIPSQDASKNEYIVDVNAYASQITVVGEIHKLASQYTFSRDWGGVHFVSDGYAGMYVGQSVAIRYLQQILAGVPSRVIETDNYVIFPTFDGKKVRVSPTKIEFVENNQLWKCVADPEDLYPDFQMMHG